MYTLCFLPGDGIGPEVIREAEKVCRALSIPCTIDLFPFGGAAIDACNSSFPDATRDACRAADAVLLGAVGGPKWDALPSVMRPERGLLALRSDLGVFANLRPAIAYAPLAHTSTLKEAVIADLDILIVRELTGGIYFGNPRGIHEENGERIGINTLRYSETEIRRIAHVAFQAAQKRHKELVSVDKANVLEATQLWRTVVDETACAYPDVAVRHMYVDNAAMQLIKNPKQFDVIVTTNLFGDILSDCAAMLTGSIGLLPSAALDATNKGLYEPVHGSAPDIAGTDTANPLATILSLAMLLRHSLGEYAAADTIEAAVRSTLDDGLRTQDIANGGAYISTAAMGNAVCARLTA